MEYGSEWEHGGRRDSNSCGNFQYGIEFYPLSFPLRVNVFFLGHCTKTRRLFSNNFHLETSYGLRNRTI